VSAEDLERGAALIRSLAGGPLDLAVVLGSGLAPALAGCFDARELAYAELPGMPRLQIAGHPGRLFTGTWHGKRVALFAGRVHLYQGYSAGDVVFGVRLAARAGAKCIVLTNAAGALSPEFAAGEIMLIADHLNFTGASPLAGGGEQFVDMRDAYSPRLRRLAAQAGESSGTALREGIYAGVLGPEYETPAYARFLRAAGADAVGMSTVLETTAARALGLEVLGLSALTNAAGLETTSHEDVLRRSGEAGAGLAAILDCAVPLI
jgi:purine-nucleoside phosphorylase